MVTTVGVDHHELKNMVGIPNYDIIHKLRACAIRIRTRLGWLGLGFITFATNRVARDVEFGECCVLFDPIRHVVRAFIPN